MEKLNLKESEYKSINHLKTIMAVKFLQEKIDSTPNVNHWASAYGVSESWLYQNVKRHYSVTPYSIIKKIRYDKICLSVAQDINITGYAVAIDAGLNDEVSVSKFLRRHFNTTLNELKLNLIKNGNLKRF